MGSNEKGMRHDNSKILGFGGGAGDERKESARSGRCYEEYA